MVSGLASFPKNWHIYKICKWSSNESFLKLPKKSLFPDFQSFIQNASEQKTTTRNHDVLEKNYQDVKDFLRKRLPKGYK